MEYCIFEFIIRSIPISALRNNAVGFLCSCFASVAVRIKVLMTSFLHSTDQTICSDRFSAAINVRQFAFVNYAYASRLTYFSFSV
jgi:hypothetical protein